MLGTYLAHVTCKVTHKMTCLVTGKVTHKMSLKEHLDTCKKYQPFAPVVRLTIFLLPNTKLSFIMEQRGERDAGFYLIGCSVNALVEQCFTENSMEQYFICILIENCYIWIWIELFALSAFRPKCKMLWFHNKWLHSNFWLCRVVSCLFRSIVHHVAGAPWSYGHFGPSSGFLLKLTYV
jgi:hypothetical protein